MTFAQKEYDHQRIYLFPSEAIAEGHPGKRV